MDLLVWGLKKGRLINEDLSVRPGLQEKKECLLNGPALLSRKTLETTKQSQSPWSMESPPSHKLNINNTCTYSKGLELGTLEKIVLQGTLENGAEGNTRENGAAGNTREWC